ncbi:hypothetical protein [Legionella sp. WA2022007384]
MRIKERLIALENEVKDVKSIQLELAKKSALMQLLIAQMEQELNQYEDANESNESVKVNNGELLSTHGLMKKPPQEVSQELIPPVFPNP